MVHISRTTMIQKNFEKYRTYCDGGWHDPCASKTANHSAETFIIISFISHDRVCVYVYIFFRFGALTTDRTTQKKIYRDKNKKKKQIVCIEEYFYAQNNVIFPSSSLLSVSSFTSTNNPEQ